MDQVTNRQLYEAIQSIESKIDTIADKRIVPLERAIDRIKVYGSIILIIIGLLGSTINDFIRHKLGF